MVRLLAAAALITLAVGPAPAQWTITDEESVNLAYGPANDQTFSISCGGAGSDVVVVVPPGVKPPPGPVTLTITEGKGTRKLMLPIELCGGETACTDRKDGEVAVYRVFRKGKTLALDTTRRATAFALDAPGAKLDIKADAKIFTRFGIMCRKKR